MTDTPAPFEPGTASHALLRRKAAVVPRAVDLHLRSFAVRAQGARIWDADGHEFLDLAGGVGCLNVGHSHPRVVAALRAQVERFTHTDFSVMPYESYVALAERITALVPGPSTKQAVFFNSGAEAVENAVKVARIATRRPAVIAFEGAFHGRTYMALSLTSKIDPYKRNLGPFMPEVYRAPYPDPYRTPTSDASTYALGRLEAMFATTVDPAQVAAIVVEPVLGEGGFVVPPSDFLSGLRSLCDQHGILLVADEVQTGMGRTGRMFAVEHAGIEPDLLVTGKSLAAGLPLSALIGRAEIFDRVPSNAVGGTYVGNPLGCVAALAVLDVIAEERLLERAERIGAVIRRRFEAFARRSPLVGHVRGLGAMVAMELVRDRATKEPAADETAALIADALAHGVLVLRAGVYGNVVRILTPLVITEEDLDRGLDVLGDALDRVQAPATRMPAPALNAE